MQNVFSLRMMTGRPADTRIGSDVKHLQILLAVYNLLIYRHDVLIQLSGMATVKFLHEGRYELCSRFTFMADGSCWFSNELFVSHRSNLTIYCIPK